MATPLDSFTPEELVLIAPLVAIALAEPLLNADALLLASFLSNISSGMFLFVTKRGRDTVPDEPSLL